MAVKSNLEKVYKVKSQNGYYLFKLNSLISKSGRSKNSIKNEKDIDFNSMQRMIKGTTSRLDLDIVAKLCNVFNCGIEDLVEYINVEEEK